MITRSLIIFICTFAVQTLGNSDLADVDAAASTKSSDGMPASVVLLLLMMFIALGIIGIRHIRRDFLQQQSYLVAKKAGAIFRTMSSKSYGSTISPQLNQDNIDEYIDDQLYGDWNNAILDRLNHYRQNLQQRFVNYMEQTPEPVLFEANPDRSVEAYCKNPEIPSNPNYDPQAYQHIVEAHYDATPSDALQSMFQANYQRNQQRKKTKQDQNEYGQIDDLVEKNRKRSLADYSAYCGDDDDHNTDNNHDYDVIPDDNAYSDSDQEISDSDNGNGCISNRNDEPVVTKVVVLDLD